MAYIEPEELAYREPGEEHRTVFAGHLSDNEAADSVIALSEWPVQVEEIAHMTVKGEPVTVVVWYEIVDE